MNHILTQNQIDFFVEHNYLVLENAFSPDLARLWVQEAMDQENIDMDDPSTYPGPRKVLPKTKFADVLSISDTWWGAICDLLGGEERVDDREAGRRQISNVVRSAQRSVPQFQVHVLRGER